MFVRVWDDHASSVLQIHGGSGGIRTFATQTVKRLGIKVFFSHSRFVFKLTFTT